MRSNIEIKELFSRPTDERALLSYCMRDLSSYFDVCAKLSPSDFLYEQHQLLMLLFEGLTIKGSESFDTELIQAEAIAQGVMDSIGGIKYLHAISNMKVSPKNFEIHLSSVVESATKYKLYKLLNDGLEELSNNSKDGTNSSDLLASVESSIMDLSMSGFNINEPINLSSGLKEFIEYKKENYVELSGLSTGYPILDKQIDGLVPGTLFVVAARPKMGKSTLLTNISEYVSYKESKPVLYVDTELRFEEWRTRVLSSVSGIKERVIKHGGYDDITYSKLIKATKIIEGGKLFHEYMPGYSVDKLVALYKKYRHKEKIGLIVFDYLKEPDSSSVDRQRKEYQLLGDVTTKLKDLAGQLDIPAITAVQLSRDGDVADSDRIARYADVIAHWGYRKKDEIEEAGEQAGTHKLCIRQTRRGGATSDHGIGYMFFKDVCTIAEVPAEKQYYNNYDKVVNADSAKYENQVLS